MSLSMLFVRYRYNIFFLTKSFVTLKRKMICYHCSKTKLECRETNKWKRIFCTLEALASFNLIIITCMNHFVSIWIAQCHSHSRWVWSSVKTMINLNEFNFSILKHLACRSTMWQNLLNFIIFCVKSIFSFLSVSFFCFIIFLYFVRYAIRLRFT